MIIYFEKILLCNFITFLEIDYFSKKKRKIFIFENSNGKIKKFKK
jgi:hypothetical protein